MENKSTNESKYSDNVIMKLRRLEIEENQLLKNLKQVNKCALQDGEVSKLVDDSEYMGKNIFMLCNDIQTLVERIKADTCLESLKNADLEDIKKDVLEFESKKINFYNSIRTEMKALKNEEQELVEELKKTPSEIKLPKKSAKTKVLKDIIISSPVHNLINSPLKHSDVQLFQDFIVSSKNRYGSWAPYHHNIFVQTWNKYFSKIFEKIEFDELDIISSAAFSSFTDEILRKITDIKLEEIIEHSKWYTKYVHLKNLQQKAINRWKMNRKLIKNTCRKNTTREQKLTEDIKKKSRDSKLAETDLVYLVSDEIKQMKRRFTTEVKRGEFSAVNLNSDDGPHGAKEIAKVEPIKSSIVPSYLKPTSQWNNWCTSTSECVQIQTIQTIPKLRVPTWRSGMQL